jgi:hypothetical protein
LDVLTGPDIIDPASGEPINYEEWYVEEVAKRYLRLYESTNGPFPH